MLLCGNSLHHLLSTRDRAGGRRIKQRSRSLRRSRDSTTVSLAMMAAWRRSFWKALWFALRRSREDKRARAAILSLAVLLVLVLAEGWLVFVLPVRERHGVFQGSFNAFIIVTGLIASLLIRRSNRKQSELLNFSVTGRVTRQSPEQVSLSIRIYLEERTVIVASLLARGASEVYLANNELPVGAEVVTRQIQNSTLRKMGLWEKLHPAENALASAADGLWTAEQRMGVIAWCEQLRLLPWTIGIDAELIPLAHCPKVDYALVHDLLRGRVLIGRTPVRAPWDLRGERDIAVEYVARIVAELKARSPIADSLEPDDWRDQLREQSLGASADYLAGAKTIAELAEEPLRLLGIVALSRSHYAGYLADQLSATEPLPFLVWSETKT